MSADWDLVEGDPIQDLAESVARPLWRDTNAVPYLDSQT